MKIKKTSIALASAALMAATLVACGGGGGVSENAAVVAPTSSSISGVAATGRALVGAEITLMDVNGTIATKTADSNGAYNFDVTQLTAPFVITAKIQVGDTFLSLTSMVSEKPAAGITGTANITPLTHAMAALLAPNGNPEELSVASVLKATVTKTKLDEVAGKIKASIENILKDAGIDPTKFDPVTTVFTANRQGADRVLELVRVEVTGKGVSLSNPSVVDDGNGSSSVTITRGATEAPKVLPAPLAGTVLNSLDHFSTLLNACFADTPAVRVTAKDVITGVPTALSAACTSVPMATNYKSGGDNAMTHYADLLNSADFTGAKFSPPERLYTSINGTVYFRLPYKTAAGMGGIITDVAGQTSPAGKNYKWEMVGNQRDYESSVDARLENNTQLNGSNTQESGKSHYRVAVRLSFNPITRAGLNVQMVRVKGPGLPADGVVMNRSSMCGTHDFMTITNKTGKLLNPSGQPYLFNASGANNYKIAAELKTGGYDWTKVASSTSWRDMPMTDGELAAIPSFAEYTWELWTFGSNRSYRKDITNLTKPDVTYTQRLNSRLPSVGSLKTLPWNTLEANDFLNPSSSLAAPQSAAAVSWKATAEPVDNVYAAGQKNTAAFGSTPATFVVVGANNHTGLKITDYSKNVSPALDPSGTASIALLVNTVSVPNCATTPFPALDAAVGIKDGPYQYATLREVSIRSKSYNLTRKYVGNSWSNFID